MSELIIGGTSGLGLELARAAAEQDKHVIVTGRHDPEVDFVQYREFDLSGGDLPVRIGRFVSELPEVSALIYAAGYYQEGHVTDLSDEEIDEMIDVCARGLVFFTKKLLDSQGGLPELVTVTSTSQWTPREYEQVYNFAKAAAGHYSNGLSLDGRVGKTLVAGPSGMATDFWKATGRDTSAMLDPAWVADRIMELRDDEYEYQFVRILGAFADLPDRIEVVETRS